MLRLMESKENNQPVRQPSPQFSNHYTANSLLYQPVFVCLFVF